MIRKLVAFGMIIVCTGSNSFAGDPHRLTIAGSSTIQPLAEVAAQAYEKKHPGVRIDVQGGGSSVGISSARSGLSDIGTVSRALHSADESDLFPTTIALDGLAIITHASNPLKNITKQQVIDIYTGKITNWKQLGWIDKAIVVVNKEEGRATLELFEKYFDLKGKFVKSAVIIGPNGQAITTVAGNPQAVAYVSIGSAAVAEGEGTTIHRLSLEGIEASVENIKNNTYGLRRPLTMVTKSRPSGLAKDYLDFILGHEGQKLVLEQDFVPLTSGLKQTKN
jgi:phosphate transport system substrate-binding protein